MLGAPQIATAAGSIAMFNSNMTMPLVSCRLTIVPAQEGSGDPSPTNIRPLSGWTSVNMYFSPTEFEEDGVTTTIDFGEYTGLVYGGTYEATTGVFTVTMAKMGIGVLDWKYRGEMASSGMFTANAPFKTNKSNYYCDRYRTVDHSLYVSAMPDKSLKGYPGTESDVIYIRDTSHKSVDTFKPAIAGAQLVYELDEPIMYQFTPQQMSAMRGSNYIWMDAAGTTTVKYWTH